MAQVRPARPSAGRGHRRLVGHRCRDRAGPGRGRSPGRPRRAPHRQAATRSPPRSGPAAARRSCTPLDLTDADSVTAFAETVTADLGDIEVVVCNAGAVAPGAIHEVDTERFAREIDLNLVGAHRLVRAFVPGMVERRRGDLVFVSSDVAVRRAAVHVVVRRRQVGPRGHGARHADGARGHRRPRLRSCAPGPTWSEMGSRLGRRGRRPTCINQWVRFGLARHPHFLKPTADRRRDHHDRVSAPRGVHLNLIEVSPEAPVEDR